MSAVAMSTALTFESARTVDIKAKLEPYGTRQNAGTVLSLEMSKLAFCRFETHIASILFLRDAGGMAS